MIIYLKILISFLRCHERVEAGAEAREADGVDLANEDAGDLQIDPVEPRIVRDLQDMKGIEQDLQRNTIANLSKKLVRIRFGIASESVSKRRRKRRSFRVRFEIDFCALNEKRLIHTSCVCHSVVNVIKLFLEEI